MKMKKFFGNALNGYSLLELLATVTVLVALATVMLPSVTVNKKTIYNTTEAYNMSGTQRYIEMFNAMYKDLEGTLGAYNCYPNNFSTGFADTGDPATTAMPAAGRLSLDTISLLSNAQDGGAVVLTPANVDTSGDTVVVTCGDIRVTGGDEIIADPVNMTTANAISLYKAGIRSLNYGTAGNKPFASQAGGMEVAGIATPDANTSTTVYANGAAAETFIIKYNATAMNSIPRNCKLNAAKTAVVAGTDFVTLNGYTANQWGTLCKDANDDIMFLFVTPNMDWSNYYADANYTESGANLVFSNQIIKESKVSVPIPATSPWMPVDSYRYYIAVFDVCSGTVAGPTTLQISDATTATDLAIVTDLKAIPAAKLLGILSPSNLSTATP